MEQTKTQKSSFINKVGMVPIVVAGISILLIVITAFVGHPSAAYKGFFGTINGFFARSILGISEIFGSSYGTGIILFTILVRLVVLPLMIYQIDSAKKMSAVAPQIKEITNKYRGKRDTASMQAMQEETRAIYKANDVNQFASLLPLLIQLPILMALYWSILQTPELQQGKFLWFQLGHTDPMFILPILAAIFTFISSWMSTASLENQPAFTKVMPYIFPVIILITAANLPAALALYWVIGNAFQSIQTYFLQNPFKIRKERREKARQEKELQKAIEKKIKKAHNKRK